MVPAMKRTIVVTGASRGIGLAAARSLERDGWHVVGIARTRPDDFPGELIATDLADQDQTARLADRLAGRPEIVGIVNNAGIVRHETAGAVDAGHAMRLLDINWRPALQLTQALLPNMRRAKFGRVVSVSSLVVKGLPFRLSYAASKAALESLTRTVAVEQAPYGITANTVAPGPTETELFRANNPTGSAAEARYLSQIPMARLGKPDEIGDVIAFLASDRASFVTGQTIGVDGGASLSSGPIAAG
jgi:3-oxoacyl-[acyl-carrier protein] reductase